MYPTMSCAAMGAEACVAAPEPDWKEDWHEWALHRKNLFPGIFTLVAFALFGSPVMAGFELAMDTSVAYWIGHRAWLVLLVPIMLAICHLVHVFKGGRPVYFAMLFSTVIPAVVLMSVGYSHWFALDGIVDGLLSTDCRMGEKVALNEAYLQAESVLLKCLGRMQNGTKQADLKTYLVLDDCEEYQVPTRDSDQYSKWRARWAYLAALEDEQDCGGWCFVGQTSLWTPRDQNRDLCSHSAAASLNRTARWHTQRLLIVGLIALCVSSAALVAIQELFVALDVRW